MIPHIGLLLRPAEEAGIKVPEGITEDNLDSFRESHPHFFVYCMLQMNAPLPSPSAHWGNAKVVAAISGKEITQVTEPDLLARGFAI